MKKIASLLFISPKTVESHIRNIMQKLECHSQEYIRDFIEKTNKLIFIKQYYLYLLIETAFNKQLKKLFAITNKNNIYCAIHFHKNNNKEKFFFDKLKHHLTITGIKIFNNDKNINNEQINLYIISRDSSKNLNYQESNKIFLTIDDDISLSDNQNIDLVSFNHKKEYYYSLFSLLKKIFPSVDIEQLIKNFKSQYNNLQNTLDNIFIKTSNASLKQKLFYKFFDHFYFKKNVLFKYHIFILLTIVSLVFFGFYQTKIFVKPKKEILSTKNVSSWNLPLMPNHYTNRDKLTTLIWSKLSKKKKKNNATLLGLYGLGGVGKTTLAINTIHNSRHHYKFKGWINAETKETLQADFFTLGKKFNLFPKEITDKLKIQLVKEWLEKQKDFLIVFDNAPNMEILTNYIPNIGHVIITSRNYNLPNAIEIDVMTEQESLVMFNNIVTNKLINTDNNNNKLKRLIKELGYLPLAVAQAGAYINENVLTISDYLKLYNNNKTELLTDKSLPPGDKHAPVYVTWNIICKSLQTNTHGEKALELLKFISFCYTEKIPRKLLMQYLYGYANDDTEIKLNKVLKLLRGYSLIKLFPNTVSIHRLLHSWLKDNQTNITHKIVILKKSINVIKNNYQLANKKTDAIEFTKNLTPHTEFLYNEIKSFVTEKELIDIMFVLGDQYYTLGNYHKSKFFFDKVLAINEKSYGTSNINTVKALRYLSIVHLQMSNHYESEKLSEKAFKIIKKYHPTEYTEMIHIISVLSWSYLNLGKFTNAKKLAEDALTIIETHCNSNKLIMSSVLHDLGWIYLCLGEYSKSIQCIEQSLELKKTHLGPTHVSVATSMSNLGLAYVFWGEYIEAKNLLEKALAIKEKHYGAEHISTITTLHILGLAYLYLGNYKQSKKLLKKNLEIKSKYGQVHLPKALRHLAWVSTHLNHKEIQNMINKSFSIAKDLYGEYHVFTAISLATKGNLYRIFNEFHKSEIMLQKSLSFLKKFYGDNNVNVAIVMSNLGLLYGDLGENKKKAKYLQDALIVFQKYLSPNNIYIKQTLKELNNITTTNQSSGYLIIF